MPKPSVTARAPAKINLQLAVGAPRRDGFHDVATAYHAISLYDAVTASPRWRAPLQVVLVEILTLLALFGMQQYFAP